MTVLIMLQAAAFALVNASLTDFWDIFDGTAASRKLAPQCLAGLALSALAFLFSSLALMPQK